MKKSLIILFAAAFLAACSSTEKMDSKAGASLNQLDTLAKFEALTAKVEAVSTNPNTTPEEIAAAQAEVKEFMKYLESYKNSATPAAQDHIDEYTSTLKESVIFRTRDSD